MYGSDAGGGVAAAAYNRLMRRDKQRVSIQQTHPWAWRRRVFEPFVVGVVNLVSPIDGIGRLSVCVHRHIAVVLRVAEGASYEGTKILGERE
jgi:hypothetical protein